MRYERRKYVLGDMQEYEYVGKGMMLGNGGARKRTLEQMRKQNQQNREKEVRRLIAANFHAGDLWVTLKYPVRSKKSIREVKRDVKEFLRRMRREYNRNGLEFKFIYRAEYGELNHNIHIHLICNHPDFLGKAPKSTMILGFLSDMWHCGDIYCDFLFEAHGFKYLAKYITKRYEENNEELQERYTKDDIKYLLKISSSRNLVRPKPEITKASGYEIVRMIEDGVSITPGYYLDKDSFEFGINGFTGMLYLRYREIKGPIYEMNSAC